jgi:hypothetical protein
MAFTKEDKILIKILRQEKGYGAKKFLKEFPNRSWSRSSLDKLLKKIDQTGTVDRRPGSGKKRTARTVENVESVEELALSQENAPGTHRTVRQIAREIGISKSSVHDIIVNDLNLVCFKKRRAHELTAANKLTRLVRAKQLLKIYPEHTVPFIWFTDEKIFTVAPPVNLQNDRIYAAAGTRKKQVPAERLLKTRSNFSKSLMVSVGVSTLGCTDLIFVEPGAKVNGAYYRDVLLTQHLLPAIKQISGGYFTFQQDSAPAHRAGETIALLSRETPDFISPQLWPPNSPDLNPVDYQIWSVLEERVYHTRIRDTDHLKARLNEEWQLFNHVIIDRAIKQWRPRLRSCVREQGGHFEHQM